MASVCEPCEGSRHIIESGCTSLQFFSGFQIDDYAKDGGPGEVWLVCSFYHKPLRTRTETNVNKFAISNHTALKLDVQALRSYLSLICEYELYILPNKKLVLQRIMVKITWRTDHPWSAIFCIIVCWKPWIPSVLTDTMKQKMSKLLRPVTHQPLIQMTWNWKMKHSASFIITCNYLGLLLISITNILLTSYANQQQERNFYLCRYPAAPNLSTTWDVTS